MDPVEVFKVLIKLKSGDTLCSDLTIVEHKTWFSSFKRLLYGDTRGTTVNLIESVVERYCASKKDCTYLKTQDIEMLEKVRTGIKNLRETYSEDSSIQERLDKCYHQLRKLITEKQELSSSADEEKISEDDNESSEFDIEDCGLIPSLPPSSSQSSSLETRTDKTSKNPFNSIEIKMEEIDVEEEEEKEEEEDRQYEEEAKVEEKEITQDKGKEKVEDKEIDLSKAKVASKFESYLKKKSYIANRGQRYRNVHGSRPVSANRGSSTDNTQSHRKHTKLHVITMGNVLSEIDALPEALSNPLSSVSSSPKPREVAWYVERFIRK